MLKNNVEHMLFKMMDDAHQCSSVFQECELFLMDPENNGSL